MTSTTLGDTGTGRRLVIWGVLLLLLAALIFITFAGGVGAAEDVMPTETAELTALITAVAGLVTAITGLVLAFRAKTAAE